MKDRELRGILINLVNQTCCHMNEQDKFVDQAISLIKALYKPLGKEELKNIVFENHHGKTWGDCAKSVAQAIINARDKKGKN